jgi:hypothetical protein
MSKGRSGVAMIFAITTSDPLHIAGPAEIATSLVASRRSGIVRFKSPAGHVDGMSRSSMVGASGPEQA